MVVNRLFFNAAVKTVRVRVYIALIGHHTLIIGRVIEIPPEKSRDNARVRSRRTPRRVLKHRSIAQCESRAPLVPSLSVVSRLCVCLFCVCAVGISVLSYF